MQRCKREEEYACSAQCPNLLPETVGAVESHPLVIVVDEGHTLLFDEFHLPSSLLHVTDLDTDQAKLQSLAIHSL